MPDAGAQLARLRKKQDATRCGVPIVAIDFTRPSFPAPGPPARAPRRYHFGKVFMFCSSCRCCRPAPVLLRAVLIRPRARSISVVNHAMGSALAQVRVEAEAYGRKLSGAYGRSDHSALSGERPIVVDQAGGYIIGPTPRSEWGWVFGRTGAGFNLRADDPELWAALGPVFDAAAAADAAQGGADLTDAVGIELPSRLAGAAGLVLGPGRRYAFVVEGPVRDNGLTAIFSLVIATVAAALLGVAAALRVQAADTRASEAIVRDNKSRAESRKTFLRAVFHDVRVPAQGIVLGLGMLLSEMAGTRETRAAALAAVAASLGGAPSSSKRGGVCGQGNKFPDSSTPSSPRITL